MNRSVITIATGKELYIKLAVNLARSFFWWNQDTDIRFIIVTDQPEKIPSDIANKIQIHQVQADELGKGFSSKLNLDKLTPEGQTLFIDSDCLVFANLDFIFERFKGHPVSVVGNYIAEGEWFGDVKKVCRQFNIPHLPKFNGGIYYVEKSPEADAVYKTARELEIRYDEIGFTRLRNLPNDELLMALAMQLHDQHPIPDDAMIMSDPQACPGGYFIDVIKGKRWLFNPPTPHPMHQSWYPFENVSPVIVHFLGYHTLNYPYRREVYRLEKAFGNKLNTFTIAGSLLLIEYPARLKGLLKNKLRTTYHKIFGIRKIQTSERI
jgi:hypothetical protein